MISVTAIRNRGSSNVWLTSMAARIAWVWWRIAASVRVAYQRSHAPTITGMFQRTLPWQRVPEFRVLGSSWNPPKR